MSLSTMNMTTTGSKLITFRHSEKATTFEEILVTKYVLSKNWENFSKFCGLLRISELYTVSP